MLLGIFNGDLAGEFGRLGSRWIRNDVGTLDAASIQICTKSFTLNTTDFVFLTDFSLYLTLKGNFNVQFSSQSGNDIKILVHDLGRKLFEKAYDNTGSFNQNIQLQDIQAGLYLVSMTVMLSRSRRRLIKHNRILIIKKETLVCFPLFIPIKLVIVTQVLLYQMIL
jgi:hypothetical protein